MSKPDLVERRLKYIERQIALDKGAVDVKFGEQPDVDDQRWKLEVGGLVENPLTLDWEQLLALPQVDDVSDFHCVTTWSRYNNHWRGVRFRTIAELAVPRDNARFVLCTGYDFAPGTFIPYTT